MKYRVESFFEKYKIEPNISLQELRVIFQTDPNKRRDLPIVVKLISSPLLLLEEELFTCHNSVDTLLVNHTNLLNNLSKLKEKITAPVMRELFRNLRYICENDNQWNAFYYFQLAQQQGEKIVIDFINCIFDTLFHEFCISIGETTNSVLIDFYSNLCDIAGSFEFLNEKKQMIANELCNYVDNSLSLDEHSKVFGKKFECLMSLGNVINYTNYKESVKYVINKMLEDIDTYGIILLNNYKQIASFFNENELLEISYFINRMAVEYADIACRNVKASPKQVIDICGKIIEAYNILKKSVSNLHNIENGKYSFSVEAMEDNKKYATFLVKAGVDWYSSYRSKIKELSIDTSMQDMYSLVTHIMSASPTNEIKDILANIIIDKSDFELIFTYLLTSHSEAMDGKADKYISHKDVDMFIGKYYWLIFMLKDKSLLNEKIFNSIRQFSFDILSIYNSLMKLMEFEYDPYRKRDMALKVQEGIRNILKNIPPDYFFDETTRVVDAVTKFGGTHYGSPSDSSLYIDKYCDLFGKPRTKYGRDAYENRNRRTTSTSSYTSSSPSVSSSTSQQQSKSGCYVATCVYGSYDCPEVWMLRRYRDCHLDNTWFGRLFIKIYYAISPTLVKLFGKTKWFKFFAKKFIEKKLSKLKNEGYADTPYNDKY